MGRREGLNKGAIDMGTRELALSTITKSKRASNLTDSQTNTLINIFHEIISSKTQDPISPSPVPALNSLALVEQKFGFDPDGHQGRLFSCRDVLLLRGVLQPR